MLVRVCFQGTLASWLGEGGRGKKEGEGGTGRGGGLEQVVVWQRDMPRSEDGHRRCRPSLVGRMVTCTMPSRRSWPPRRLPGFWGPWTPWSRHTLGSNSCSRHPSSRSAGDGGADHACDPLVKLRAGREACSEVHRVRYRSARETTNQDRTVHMYSVCTRIPCRPGCIAGTDTEAGPCGLQRGPVRDQPARGEALRHADGAQAAAPEGCHR